MWEKGCVWDGEEEEGKKRDLGTWVAVLLSRKADAGIICNKLEMLGTIFVTGKDSFS